MDDDFEKRGITQDRPEEIPIYSPKNKNLPLNFTKLLELGVFFQKVSIATATRLLDV